jgi:hypothetical protein
MGARMHGLSDELLRNAREHARSVQANAFVQPEPGQLWTVAEIIRDQKGNVREQSWTPIEVALLKVRDAVLEVVPISYELQFAGPDDVIVDDEPLFGQAFMLESWLRLPMLRSALGRGVGRLSPSVRQRLEAMVAVPPTERFEDADPRSAYRSDERLRVYFAAAGTLDGLTLPFDEAFARALRMKQAAPTWRLAPVAPERTQTPGGSTATRPQITPA